MPFISFAVIVVAIFAFLVCASSVKSGIIDILPEDVLGLIVGKMISPYNLETVKTATLVSKLFNKLTRQLVSELADKDFSILNNHYIACAEYENETGDTPSGLIMIPASTTVKLPEKLQARMLAAYKYRCDSPMIYEWLALVYAALFSSFSMASNLLTRLYGLYTGAFPEDMFIPDLLGQFGVVSAGFIFPFAFLTGRLAKRQSSILAGPGNILHKIDLITADYADALKVKIPNSWMVVISACMASIVERTGESLEVGYLYGRDLDFKFGFARAVKFLLTLILFVVIYAPMTLEPMQTVFYLSKWEQIAVIAVIFSWEIWNLTCA